MGGVGECQWPVWQVDDLTPCFQHDYLRILFPAIVIGLSVLKLGFRGARHAATRSKSASTHAYAPVSNGDNSRPGAHRTDISPDDDAIAQDDEDDEGLAIGGGRLALVKTTTKGSIVQADTPPAQTLSVVVEELAIAGLVAIYVVAMLSPDAHGSYTLAGRIIGLTTWVYVLLLATLRLFLGNTQWRVPHLWNHTAAIYSCQWLFLLGIFRSALIHPSSKLAQILVIVEFALTSLLFFMAITTRQGNKTVLLEWEDGIPPARENLASLFSSFTFSWVNQIVWQGYKEPFDMSKVWNLLPKDKAATVLSHYRRVKKTTKLYWHLLRYFKGDLLAQAGWAVMSGMFTFAPTMLLKAILEYVEEPDSAPRSVVWLYVILLPVTDIIQSLGNNRALWIGRKICINVRAILVGEIYAKALRRKAATGKDTVLGSEKKDDKPKGGFISKIKKMLCLGGKDESEDGKDGDKDKDDSSDEQANHGTIINLMSVDSFNVSEVTSYLHFLFASAPTQLLVSVILLYQVLGLSAIPGFIVMVLLLPVNIGFGRAFNSTQKKIMACSDKRIHSTNEVLQNIRIIKYFAWEHRFGESVDEKRKAELKALRARYMVWACAVAVWNTVPILITFFSFLVYTTIEKRPLHPSIAFTSISLFMLLRHPLDQLGDMLAHVQEAKVSIDRIEQFLSEEETEKFIQLGEDNVNEEGTRMIALKDAAFIWGGKDVIEADGSQAFRLLDIDTEFMIGKLNVITGPTGSGKTSLLMALLGEMTLLKGRVYLPGGRSREDVRPDPETGLAETCAYVAQQAWLVNASIKDNILFSARFDEKRYRDVIVACALERDLEILDNGDETLVGEKGITLSGGQKQRISLARAVYSNSKHLLLDDCLSAVDSHTAQWIFNNCIRGPLMKDRTCIMVTHNIPLCVPHSDFVVVMDNGRITHQGKALEVITSGALGEEIAQKAKSETPNISRIPSRVPSSVGEGSSNTLLDTDGDDHLSKPKGTKKPKKADAMEETKATGAVKWPVMKLYLASMGSWWFWVVAACIFVSQQAGDLASNLWIKEWASQYTTEVSSVPIATSSHTYGTQSFAPTYMVPVQTYVKDQLARNGNATALDIVVNSEVNAQYYLVILAIIGLAGSLTAFLRDLWIFFGSLTASAKIHTRLLGAVTRAKFRFFDVTPLGQMMNRFSKDMEAVDQEVAPIAIGILSCALGITVTVVLIASITPGFLIAAVFITMAYILLAKFYLTSSRDLKRLESVQRSPLFQQFGETLSGVTTIRAYGDERRFVRDNLTHINGQLRPMIYLWATNRWLAFRTDLLGDFVSFFAGVFVILSIGVIDAGWAGISLSYAIGFAENILWLVRLYSINEQNMNAVERIKEYLEVEQEAAPICENNRPPQNWPAQGSVEFINYTTSYRKELDPVLRNVTFKISPQEKVGIVGRTGAGKSSLALAIFRALEADGGKILIDGIDIGLIGLRDLREAITIVPQEPTLFTGTIRSNLDPFHLFTDEQIYKSLQRVQLIGPDEAIPTADASPVVPASPTTPGGASNKNIFLNLSSKVSESGSNLSQGQRQLLCLARALLKEPRVLVMDEATASIDYATDSKIQDTIREMKDTTIITIAHRLQTIADYDKVLVLDKGEVVEYAHPWELMRKGEGGSFKSMCDMSGDTELLAKAAKKAFDAKKLIDVDDEAADAAP
ncbi:ABC transporter 7 [Pyricularia grisea]|nr:ABC transporter 7 [Pyricularia grisea]